MAASNIKFCISLFTPIIVFLLTHYQLYSHIKSPGLKYLLAKADLPLPSTTVTSTWFLTLESTLKNSTSRCDSWGLPLINGEIANDAPTIPTMAISFLISKLLLASIKLPYLKCFRKLLFAVKILIRYKTSPTFRDE